MPLITTSSLEQLSRLANVPSVTLDGVAVELLANIELPADAPDALRLRLQHVYARLVQNWTDI